MRAVVLVPRRSASAERERLWEHVRAFWRPSGYPVFEGQAEGEPFNRSAARNDAAAQAGDWEVAILADADTLIPPEQVTAAVRHAHETGELVFPFTEYCALTAQTTRRVLRNEDTRWRFKWIKSHSVGGCMVCPRELWEEVGGFDQRFQGWGFEDRAFVIACETLASVQWAPGRVYHLFHERARSRDPKLATYQANEALCRRYKRANGDPTAIRELLEEADLDRREAFAEIEAGSGD